MNELDGKVAVVTGAASGIGRGMALAFAGAGMKLVLADIEEGSLDESQRLLHERGADVFSVVVDVADRASVFALADAASERFGNVHVLCNNAGVGGRIGGAGGIWNTPPEAWAWTLSVNLMGVVHGLQAFVERMIAHGEPGHIVNTSSVVGVWTGVSGAYGVSKHAVTALSENLFLDLRTRRADIGVSVLLPALTATRINTASRNWRTGGKSSESVLAPEVRKLQEQDEAYYLQNGMAPDAVGEIVLRAIRDRRFYVFTHARTERPVEARMRAIVEGRDPAPPGPSLSE